LTRSSAVPSVATSALPGTRNARHRFHPTRYDNVIGTAEPVLRLAGGDTLMTGTIVSALHRPPRETFLTATSVQGGGNMAGSRLGRPPGSPSRRRARCSISSTSSPVGSGIETSFEMEVTFRVLKACDQLALLHALSDRQAL